VLCRLPLAAIYVVTLFAVAMAAQSPAARPPADSDYPPNDYANPKAWLCRPDLPGSKNACNVDLTTTIVAADGELTREPWKPNPSADIDCFYVYPTVSTDPTEHSDMTADPAELNVVRQQLARFGSVCKLYAPMYRQITIAALLKLLSTPDPVAGLVRGVGYNDVRDAWRYYLEHDNKGRGYVLMGHSQGAYLLMQMIRQQIEGKPIQSQMVSALLLGATLPVAKGKDAGGVFQSIPLCHVRTQTGCVINYSAYRSTLPPPPNTLFGKVPDASQAAACVNPANLSGESGDLHAYLDATGRTIADAPQVKPWAAGATVDTPWVSVPGLLTARCTSNENATFLEVKVHSNPADPRVDDITGDIGSAAQPLAEWGLHLIDVNLAMGNLVDIVGAQAQVFSRKK
jgi:hypothetical protein